MSLGTNDGERHGRVLRVGALAAAALALVAVLGPRLAFSGGGSHPEAATAPPDGLAGPGPQAAGLQVVATTTSAAAAPPTTLPTASTPTTTTTPAPASTTTTNSTSTTTTVPLPPQAPPDGGAVRLSLAGIHAGLHGPQVGFFVPGEPIGWHFRVTNTGDEFLWGVFVYLELYGPVACSEPRLEPGASADCWAETPAYDGRNQAEAWLTAWTGTRMVADRLSYNIALGAG